MTKRIYAFLVLSVFLFTEIGSALALNIQSFKPQTRRNQGAGVLTSESLEKNEFTFGVGFNWNHNPLETGTPTNRSAGIVDDFITADLLLGYGFSSVLSVNVDVPVNLYHNIGPVLIPSRDKSGGDLGDISINLPITLLKASQSESRWGFAIVPFITLPSGELSTHFGDDTVTGGANLVGDKLIGDNRIYLNVGTKFRRKETIGANLGVNHELTYGLGYQRPLVKKWNLDVLGEVSGSTTYDDFFNQDTDVPVEATVALRKSYLEDSLSVTLGGGRGLSSGYGAPDVRVFTGISYSFKPKKREPEAVSVQPHVILFDFDKSKIKPVYMGTIDEIVAQWHKNTNRHINVLGHTDSIGSNGYNDKLSAKRANNVRKAIISKGVDKDHVSVSYYGENKPVASNADSLGREKNRRVEVIHVIVK